MSKHGERYLKNGCRDTEEEHRDIATRRRREVKKRRSGDRRCPGKRRIGRRTHSGCDASESWDDRVGHRGKSSRSERIDHLSLWRWRPIRARCRKPAKNGLQKRALDGRRLQSLESRWIADGKIAIPRRLD